MLLLCGVAVKAQFIRRISVASDVPVIQAKAIAEMILPDSTTMQFTIETTCSTLLYVCACACIRFHLRKTIVLAFNILLLRCVASENYILFGLLKSCQTASILELL